MQHQIAHPGAPIMVTEQQTLANRRHAADSETAKPHSHHAEEASRGFTGHRTGRRIRSASDLRSRSGLNGESQAF
jgi:hypothetical protein